uniref:ATP-binding cassette domain-containing protein n=1 Tax=Thaumasiovibrio occultus TaxID=1891184 RepID=UPI000B34D9DB|nr:ATP-binding cassette domain-containing protein [Thaumasiovibrio occultus]
MIQCKSISLAQRVNNMSFELAKAQLVHVIGPNGCGKSSLLSVLSGMVPFSGDYQLAGRRVQQATLSELAQIRAYLPQQSGAPFAMTVVHYLNTIIEHLGDLAEVSLNETLEILDQHLHISPLFHKQTSELSGGEWQRVRLVATYLQVWPSLNPNCEVLLLDEPCSALDILHQQAVREINRYLVEQGLLVVVVNHDLNETLQHSDYVLALSNGEIVALGASREVISERLINDLFGVKVERITHNQQCYLLW